MVFPCGSGGKESTCQCRRLRRHRFSPWVGKIPGEGNGNALQYSCLGNSMDRGAWRATVYSFTELDTTERAHTQTCVCMFIYIYICFIELDKAVVHVIRLASFLWLWFQCVCPLMPSHNTYLLTWVSLTLDVGYLFMAVPAKRSRCSLPWTRGISSRPALLTLNVE